MKIFGFGSSSHGRKHKHKHKRKKRRDTTTNRQNATNTLNGHQWQVQQPPVINGYNASNTKAVGYPSQYPQNQQYSPQSPPPLYHQPVSSPPVLAWQSPPFQAPYQHRYAASQQNLSWLQPPNRNGAPWGKSTAHSSLTNLTTAVMAPVNAAMAPVIAVNDGIGELHQKTTGYLNQTAALCDQVYSKFNEVMTSIDKELFSGEDKDLTLYQNQQPYTAPMLRGGGVVKTKGSKGINSAATAAVVNTNYFSKANLYANARLPGNLNPLKCYMPTYPLICHAAHYSAQAYTKPSASSESCMHISADWRSGTKAMLIKSVPIDATSTIIFAIRGSQTFMDWAVNLNSTPASPSNFLDDPGNLVHCGFLSVAQKMIKPVAARLRKLLEENPSRASCSLLFTGHSAGGAVASLLFTHMLSSLRSDLTALTGCFKRVHCITFGAPPVSLLPLRKPSGRRHAKSLFLSFVNEGDPVPRADKAYVHSLLNLYASPVPLSQPAPTTPPQQSSTAMIPFKRPQQPPLQPQSPIWKVPPSTLCTAGRIVLLRGNNPSPRGEEGVVQAFVLDDEQLRGVIFGDPVMHMMRVYARRVERLAVDAVRGRGW